MTASPAPDNGNKAVQIAVLQTQMDAALDLLKRIEQKQDAQAEWQRATESRLATGAEKFRQLEQRDRNFGLANGIGTVIGSVIAAFIGKQP